MKCHEGKIKEKRQGIDDQNIELLFFSSLVALFSSLWRRNPYQQWCSPGIEADTSNSDEKE
jgi:hypothetical protein